MVPTEGTAARASSTSREPGMAPGKASQGEVARMERNSGEKQALEPCSGRGGGRGGGHRGGCWRGLWETPGQGPGLGPTGAYAAGVCTVIPTPDRQKQRNEVGGRCHSEQWPANAFSCCALRGLPRGRVLREGLGTGSC